MSSRFRLIPGRHGRADGQNNSISISRVSVLTRDKNDNVQYKYKIYYFVVFLSPDLVVLFIVLPHTHSKANTVP